MTTRAFIEDQRTHKKNKNPGDNKFRQMRVKTTVDAEEKLQIWEKKYNKRKRCVLV